MGRMMTLLVCIGLFLGVPAARAADAQRNPFQTPLTAGNPYAYEKAIRKLMVKGLVRVAGADRAIVSIADIRGLVVLKPGDKIALDYRGLDHEFRIGKIAAKGVRFHALRQTQESGNEADGENLFYEVQIQ